MSRSTVREPLFLHVGKRTPVTVHIRPTTRSLAKHQSDSRSGMKMSKLRPTVSTSSTSRPSCSKRSASQQVKAVGSRSSRSLASKSKSSARSLQPKLSWEGSTHRLEIHPPSHSRVAVVTNEEAAGREGGQGEGEEGEEYTTLRMSDLSRDERKDEEEEEDTNDDHANFESRIQSLQNEVDALTSRLEEEQQLHNQQTHNQQHGIPLTRSRLERHNTATHHHSTSSPEMRVLGQVASLMSSQLQQQQQERLEQEEKVRRQRREELMNKLEEVERESCTVREHVDQLHSSFKKMGKRPSAVSSQLGGQRSKLMKSMSEFKRDSQSLRKLLREQLNHVSHCDHTTNTATAAPLDTNLALHAQGLHDELGRKEVELQSLMMHTQSLEEELQKRDQDYAELQASLHQYKEKVQQEKEALKKAARQHKHRAIHNKHITEQLTQQLEQANCDLEEARCKLGQSASEKMKQQTELSSLSTRVKDLDNCLAQSKACSESAVGAVSARLTEKTHELNLLQLENDRLTTTISTIEGALKVMEETSTGKITSLEAELAQTRATSAQYEALSNEYRNQLEKCHSECDDAQREVRMKERDIERLQQDAAAELEKCRMKYEHQIAELEPLPELLKVSELRVQESQQRLSVCEQRVVEQSRLVNELTAKYDRQCGSLEEMRCKWQETMVENTSLLSRLNTAQQRVEESDGQNRSLVTAARQKQEDIQNLQSQCEERQATISSLQAQLDSSRSESRRQQEHIRDKAVGKERAHVARIADLESQLSKSNNSNSQLRKSKDEAERLHRSQLRSLQEQLDTANTSRRSMETYVNFLKASYTSLYSETDPHSAPPFHMLN